MSECTQLNAQTPRTPKPVIPLRNLNLIDDFLFDVATVDLESCKIILNTKGSNRDEVEQPLIDFFHYVEQSTDENVPDGGDLYIP